MLICTFEVGQRDRAQVTGLREGDQNQTRVLGHTVMPWVLWHSVDKAWFPTDASRAPSPPLLRESMSHQ